MAGESSENSEVDVGASRAAGGRQQSSVKRGVGLSSRHFETGAFHAAEMCTPACILQLSTIAQMYSYDRMYHFTSVRPLSQTMGGSFNSSAVFVWTFPPIRQDKSFSPHTPKTAQPRRGTRKDEYHHPLCGLGLGHADAL